MYTDMVKDVRIAFNTLFIVRFQVLTAASMMFRAVFWVVLMMEAVRTSETSIDNHFTRQYNPEDSSEHHTVYYR
jgi:hypothetical protein